MRTANTVWLCPFQWAKRRSSSIIGAVILLSMLGLNSARGAQLYFKAQSDGMGGFNYNWFSPSNWFQQVQNGVYQSANTIPGPGDDAVVTSKVNAAANSITIASLNIDPHVAVYGGDFNVDLVTLADSCSFTNSAINVQSDMYLGGNCTMTTCQITIKSGAVFFLQGAGSNNAVGTLQLSNCSVFNIGEIVLTNGSSITGGSNFVNRGYITASGDPAVSGSGTFDNSGVVQCESGLLVVGPFSVWTNSQAVGQYRTLASNSTIQFCGGAPGPTFDRNTTNILAGLGTNTFPYGATVNGLLEVGAPDTNTGTVDPGLAILSSAAVNVNGSGILHVVAAPGATSQLIWNGGTISNIELDVDAAATFTMTGPADRYLSGATVNNAGVTMTLDQAIPMHLDNGAVFNNLVGGLFDAKNDAGILGSGGGAVGFFNNQGTFRKSAGSADTYFEVESGLSASQTPTFANSGLVDAQTGRIIPGPGTNSGRMNVAGGARLYLATLTNTQAPGATFTGPGQIGLNTLVGPTAVLLLNSDVAINIFALISGTVDGAHDLTVNNSLAWSGGTMQGSGSVSLAAGSSNSITADVMLDRNLNNAGAVSIIDGGAVIGGNGTVWSNQPGSTLDIESSGVWVYGGSGGQPAFENAGTVSNGMGFGAGIGWAFTNSGLVWIRSNVFSFPAGFTQTAGQCIVDNGGTLGIPASGAALILGGELEGTGTISGNVVNSGVIHAGESPGILQLNGNTFSNLAGGTVAVDIGGTTSGGDYSQLQGVNNSTEAVLGGALQVSFINGFLPSVGDKFTIMSFSSVQAGTRFGSLSGFHAGNGVVLVPVYGPTTVNLVAANELTLGSLTRSNNQFSFTVPTTAGLTNIVEYTDRLEPAQWTLLTNLIGNGLIQLAVDQSTNGPPYRFYRARFE